ncbi:MAG: hypothetical protein U1E29_02065 [Coriobacteriia bacterium]|nr:hypothetical protein [Coriobacteriia bacterium]
MAWGRIKADHCGPKRGKGYWGKKAVAKHAGNRARRRDDRLASVLDDAAGDTESSSGERRSA